MTTLTVRVIVHFDIAISNTDSTIRSHSFRNIHPSMAVNCKEYQNTDSFMSEYRVNESGVQKLERIHEQTNQFFKA